MKKELLEYAEKNGFDENEFEEGVKKLFLRDLFQQRKLLSVLGKAECKTYPICELTELKLNDFEYNFVCAYLLSHDDFKNANRLADYCKLPVCREAIDGAKKRYFHELQNPIFDNESRVLSNLESLTSLANRYQNGEIKMEYPEKETLELHSKYLAKSEFEKSARLKSVTSIEPETKDIYTALENKLLI